MEQAGLTPTREQFQLDRIMLNNKTKIAKVWCTLDLSSSVQSKVIVVTIEPDYQANETLQNRIHDLKPYLCEIQHIKKENQNKVNALGIHCTGTKDNATWKIFGVNVSDSKQNMKLETCKTHYAGGVYTWETEVTDLITEIENEAFKYAFCGAAAVIAMGLDNANKGENGDDKIEEQN